MAELKVEGRIPLTVPDYLGGMIAAGNNARFTAHIVDLGIIAILGLVSALTVAWYDGGTAPIRIVLPLIAASTAIALVYLLVSVIGLAARGQTLGMRVAGIQWIGIDTGVPNAARSFSKCLIQSGLGLVTLGIAPAIICLVSQGEMNRTWFDRFVGTLTVRVLPEIALTPLPPAVDPANSREALAAQEASAPDGRASSDAETNAPPAASAPSAAPAAPAASAASSRSAETADSLRTVRSHWGSSDSSRRMTDSESRSELERSFGLRPKGSVRLVFDDGTKYDLVDSLIVGRAPRAVGELEGMAVFAIEDEGRSVSKSHLVLRVREGIVSVEDLGSTNGTRITTRDGTEKVLQPGVPARALPGALVHFGTRMLLVSG